MSSQDDVVPGDRVPTGNEPGADSTPAADGEGVVDVGDRTAGGSPAANQAKTEPMPPTAAHDDPDEAEPATADVPDLGSMNVGAADPQAPSHPAAAPAGDRAGGGLPVEAPAAGPEQRDAVATAPQDTSGSAYRAPGSDGVPGAGETVETDVETSAARTDVAGSPHTESGAGDAAGVPVVSEERSPGTSQESSAVQGARTPE